MSLKGAITIAAKKARAASPARVAIQRGFSYTPRAFREFGRARARGGPLAPALEKAPLSLLSVKNTVTDFCGVQASVAEKPPLECELARLKQQYSDLTDGEEYPLSSQKRKSEARFGVFWNDGIRNVRCVFWALRPRGVDTRGVERELEREREREREVF